MSDHVHRQQGCCCRKYRDAVSRIAFLEEKVKRLELENHKPRHRSLERPFGLSTPSSRQLVKPSAPETASEEAKRRMGGAKGGGHAGHGRRKADDFRGEVEELPPLDVRPRRGGRLEDFAGGSGETREIVDCELPRVRRRRIRRRVHHCPHCRKPVRAGIPGVIPKFALPDDVVDYLLRAAKLRRRIEEVVRTEGYSHPSVLNVREMFRDNDDHLWGWAMHPKIPAENNAAERAVRPLVVAHKISHGSQSAKGRETRSVLMSLMHTLNACCDNPVEVVRKVLDKYAENPGVDIFHAYFGNVALCVSER